MASSDGASAVVVASGNTTSEFSLAKWLLIGAGAIDALTLVLETLHGAGVLPDRPWVATALSIAVTLMAGLKAFGYTRSRALVKVAALQEETRRVLGEAVPLAGKYKEALSPAAKTSSSTTPPFAASKPSSST